MLVSVLIAAAHGQANLANAYMSVFHQIRIAKATGEVSIAQVREAEETVTAGTELRDLKSADQHEDNNCAPEKNGLPALKEWLVQPRQSLILAVSGMLALAVAVAILIITLTQHGSASTTISGSGNRAVYAEFAALKRSNCLVNTGQA